MVTDGSKMLQGIGAEVCKNGSWHLFAEKSENPDIPWILIVKVLSWGFPIEIIKTICGTW